MIGKKSKSKAREKNKNMLVLDDVRAEIVVSSIGASPNILTDVLTDSVWVAKVAKDKFYRLIKSAVERPQVIAHRDDGNMVLMTEEAYKQLRDGWEIAMKPKTLAEHFRGSRITHPIERPNKLRQKRPRALDIAERIDHSGRERHLTSSSSE
tara:strand:- start:24261 stop:24716 length:456 start_codon:yes stop_codon:yes gene_type:complete